MWLAKITGHNEIDPNSRAFILRTPQTDHPKQTPRFKKQPYDTPKLPSSAEVLSRSRRVRAAPLDRSQRCAPARKSAPAEPAPPDYNFREDCRGVYRMDENRRNKPYSTVFTTYFAVHMPHQSFLYFARRLLAGTMF